MSERMNVQFLCHYLQNILIFIDRFYTHHSSLIGEQVLQISSTQPHHQPPVVMNHLSLCASQAHLCVTPFSFQPSKQLFDGLFFYILYFYYLYLFLFSPSLSFLISLSFFLFV